MTCPPGALRYALVSLEVRGNGDCDSDSDVAVSISLLDPYSLVHAESRVYAEAIIAMSSSASGRSRRCLRWRCGIGDGGAGGPGMPLLRGTGEEGDHNYWKQIEKDVPRVALSPDIPASTNFRRTADTPDGEAYHQSEAFRASLGRCLHAYARRHDEVGYVQGMHNVLAFMLISGLGEEESVLLLHHIATRVLPMYWHTNDSSGKGGGNSSNSSNTILTDVLVAGFIARRELPALTHHLESIGVDLSHVTLPLFLTCFTANSMSYEFVASCWDFLLFESQPLEGAATSADEDTTNNSFMFRLILAMLKMFESELKAAADAVACIRALTSMPLRFTTGAEGVQMSVRELLLTTSEFAESCSPKQIRLLRRELASFNSAEDSPNGDGPESGNGDSPRSFQLYRSLSDSHGALQDQIDILMETLTIQGDELDKLSKESRELKEERATLICEAEEKDETIIRLSRECEMLRSELGARKVQVDMLISQQKDFLDKGLLANVDASLFQASPGSSVTSSPASSPAMSPRLEQKRSLFGRMRSGSRRHEKK